MRQTYKFRAEADIDVFSFIRLTNSQAHNFSVNYYHEGFTECIVTFESALPLHNLKSLAEQVIDGHVMVQTITLASDYTGNRVY